MTRLVGKLTGEEAWDAIAAAERIGIIERTEMVFESTMPEGQEWRLVEGFDVKDLEMAA